MRLDAYLAENQIYASRTRAERAVKMGCVKVNGRVVTKCSADVCENDNIECAPDPVGYVSRGAYKLIAALDSADIEVRGLFAVDVGASTGGFTQVLLERGAAGVTAVDVGKNQLAQEIAADPRVTVLEETDIRCLDNEIYNQKFDLLTCDCSFISLKSIMHVCHRLLKPSGRAVFLIKPQFEAGRKALNKKGIVKDDALRKKAVEEVRLFGESVGFEQLFPIIKSPIEGGDGNTEYLYIVGKR